MNIGDLKVKISLDQASIDAIPDEIIKQLADRVAAELASR